MDNDRLIAADSVDSREDQQDRAIRPASLADYHGQPKVRERLEIFIDAAAARRSPRPHPDLRPAGAGQDHPGAHHRPGNGVGTEDHLRPGAGKSR